MRGDQHFEFGWDFRWGEIPLKANLQIDPLIHSNTANEQPIVVKYTKE
jgi:hypothetical protein